MQTLEAIFPFIVGAALAAVLAVLVTGMVAMARGGEFNRKYGNRLMRARVGLQLLAIALIAVFVLLIKS